MDLLLYSKLFDLLSIEVFILLYILEFRVGNDGNVGCATIQEIIPELESSRNIEFQ